MHQGYSETWDQTDPWSIDTRDYSEATLMDLGSVTITAVVYRATSGKSTDPWSYQVDTLVLSMDLTAGKTWDQLLYGLEGCNINNWSRAASHKLQAASDKLLTRKNYRIIKDIWIQRKHYRL